MPPRKTIAKAAEPPLDDPSEPEELPEPIVEWQPTHGAGGSGLLKGAEAAPATATGATAIGMLAFGALALGALAIGALAIGRLSVGKARFRRLEIDELVVDRIVRRG